jgi:hypothetical protein
MRKPKLPARSHGRLAIFWMRGKLPVHLGLDRGGFLGERAGEVAFMGDPLHFGHVLAGFDRLPGRGNGCVFGPALTARGLSELLAAEFLCSLSRSLDVQLTGLSEPEPEVAGASTRRLGCRGRLVDPALRQLARTGKALHGFRLLFGEPIRRLPRRQGELPRMDLPDRQRVDGGLRARGVLRAPIGRWRGWRSGGRLRQLRLELGHLRRDFLWRTLPCARHPLTARRDRAHPGLEVLQLCGPLGRVRLRLQRVVASGHHGPECVRLRRLCDQHLRLLVARQSGELTLQARPRLPGSGPASSHPETAGHAHG